MAINNNTPRLLFKIKPDLYQDAILLCGDCNKIVRAYRAKTDPIRWFYSSTGDVISNEVVGFFSHWLPVAPIDDWEK